ncbi:unnamed protein product, partial [Porites evermanni]
QTTLASNLVPRALFPDFGAMEKRPGDEVALALFDRSECWGTDYTPDSLLEMLLAMGIYRTCSVFE